MYTCQQFGSFGSIIASIMLQSNSPPRKQTKKIRMDQLVHYVIIDYYIEIHRKEICSLNQNAKLFSFEHWSVQQQQQQ